MLSRKISGTIHSMVRNVVVDGLSNISTTVDPGWSGKLLISIHNYRETSIELQYGERFCTICFYQIDSIAIDNRRTDSNRVDLWNSLLTEAKKEKEKIQNRQKLFVCIAIIFLLITFIFTVYMVSKFPDKIPDQISAIMSIIAVVVSIITFIFKKDV